MKSLKKTRRVQIIAVAAVALALSTGLIGYAMRDGINFFRSPSQVMAEPPTASEVFRLGGMVEVGSLNRGQGEAITFRVTDFCNAVPVSYTGILPDLFGENEGTVATGRLIDGVFVASEILAKHDETYMPREVADAVGAEGSPNAAANRPECAYNPEMHQERES
ncbi:cytochrome c maturation protein CcmE [Pararhodobacter sp. CCB-MM2]|uniref:cytochrome c maturation protein CcmE n=1 Tax=Pararhodobacter sp. CCB-MM2 TaxID=1786003 RepID=UPI000830A624|nr:cytochrome c maturation protein CcmE [Pararhodobacter sp. CCB-MM2]MCA2010560.1 cytochrome c maturation protein CcmE [Cereibacter sphaeroides]